MGIGVRKCSGGTRLWQHDRKVFREPRQVLEGLMGQRGRANQPTKGWCAPHTLSHLTWGGGAPPPGLGGKPPPAWLGGQVSLGFSLRRSNLLGRRPSPRETLGHLLLSPPPIYSEGEKGQPQASPGAAPPSSNTSSSSVVLGEALLENHELHHHHVVVLSEFSLNFSSPLAGSRRRRRPRAVLVLNTEATSVRR